MALSAAAGGYLVRVNRLKARQRHLEGLVKARTADLEEALAVVRSQGEELRVFNQELERKVREQLETIIRNKRLTKYFPRSLVDRILLSDEDVTLTTERRVVTTFFTDLTGFTRLSDVTDPDRITALLNDYLTVMARLIGEHGGTLARFMGDGILGFFGAPDPMAPEVQAERAVRMALAMQEAMGDLGRRWEMDRGPDALRIRIGIHQDLVTLGNFGSPEHMEYTALGSGVNLAKRLESACPPGAVLVSDAIRRHLEGRFAFGPEALTTFKGFDRPVATFVVTGPRDA
jgi:class 3 adenylate cyclase